MKDLLLRLLRRIGMSMVLAFCCGMAATDGPLATDEEEGVVDAASLVRPALLSGPGFSVDPHVELRGYMAHFTLDTPVGKLTADSVEILAEREAELPALDALDRATRSDAFLHAAGDRFAAAGRTLGRIARHPVDTVRGIPAGVARYFRDRAVKLGRQAQALSDRTARTLGTDGNPWPAGEGPMTAARDAGDVPPKPKKHWYTKIGNEAEREVKRQLKYGQVKRELAQRLGIDPYTSNPYVQERLSGLAWIASSGNYGAGAVLGTIGGIGAAALSQGTRVSDVVWKLTPEDLRVRNAKRLGAWCRDDYLMRQFLRRGAFSPTLQTAFADALDALKPAAGCDELLELGMNARSELEARYLVNALRLVATHLGASSAKGELRIAGAGLAYAAPGGDLVLPLPVDRLSWTTQVRDFLDRSEFRVHDKTVLVGGAATLQARRGLTERGWNILVHAPREGTPPYARADEPGGID